MSASRMAVHVVRIACSAGWPVPRSVNSEIAAHSSAIRTCSIGSSLSDSDGVGL